MAHYSCFVSLCGATEFCSCLAIRGGSVGRADKELANWLKKLGTE